MKKAVCCLFVLLLPFLMQAFPNSFYDHIGKTGKWKNNEFVRSQSGGFSLWMNQHYALGGGLTVELGQSWPLLTWNQQFYLMFDADFRLAALKHTTVGLGGTLAGEFRVYNRRRTIANFGMEVSWGVNGMVYTNEFDDAIGHFLYGGNWMRAGYINAVGSREGEQEYFAQFQYWDGAWYVMCGMSLENFKTRKGGVRQKRDPVIHFQMYS